MSWRRGQTRECPRKTRASSSTEKVPPKVNKAEVDDKEDSPGKEKRVEDTQNNGEKNAREDGDRLKGILHEANVMLKSINGGKETKGSRDREKRLEELQKQLDDLKVRAVKVTKISCKGGGLLDSGATHAS